MNFTVFRDRLVAIGYSDDTAYADEFYGFQR